jgi:carbamate kinase
MKIVIALGGNALIQGEEETTAENQLKNLNTAADSLKPILQQNQVILTHGNGPQVGLLSLETQAYENVSPYPLDVLVAESQGMIGYLFQQSLINNVPGLKTGTILTQVMVDPADKAFENPSKPIGPWYTKDESDQLKEQYSWDFTEKDGEYRRIVPSPEPKEIMEISTIKNLIDKEVTVICCGGGGIPVSEQNGQTRGMKAVIDKDRVSALLAEKINADLLLILTDVENLFLNYGQQDEKKLSRISAAELSGYGFDQGSMGPKVEACIRFVKATGKEAAIGALKDAELILKEEKGTRIHQ